MPKKWIIVFLFSCALVNSSHLFTVDYNTPIDFRNVYLGSRLWSNNQNPYIDSVLKQEWFLICDAENISKSQPPGLPLNFLVYPPHALSLYWPFSFLSWKIAAWLNGFISLFSLIAWLVLVYRLFDEYSKLKPWIFVLIVLAFKGTTHALIVGQPSFLANLLGLAGVYSIVKGKNNHWAIVFFVLASFKPTTLLPYLIVCAYHQNWKVLFYTFIGTTAWVVGSFLLYNQPYQLLQSALHNIASLKALIFESKGIYLLTACTEFGVVFEYVFPPLDWLRSIFYAILAMVLSVFLYRNTQLNHAYLFSLIMCFVLLTTHHLFYDVLFLLPLVFVLPFYTAKNQLVIMCCSFVYFIPINGILDKMDVPAQFDFLYLTTPISLLIITIVLYLHPIKQNTSLPSPAYESLS